MNSYEKIGWLDHVEDVATGEVIQEGTPVSQTNMNHMDEGIYQNRELSFSMRHRSPTRRKRSKC